jgi:hypothetical protein
MNKILFGIMQALIRRYVNRFVKQRELTVKDILARINKDGYMELTAGPKSHGWTAVWFEEVKQ